MDSTLHFASFQTFLRAATAGEARTPRRLQGTPSSSSTAPWQPASPSPSQAPASTLSTMPSSSPPPSPPPPPPPPPPTATPCASPTPGNSGLAALAAACSGVVSSSSAATTTTPLSRSGSIAASLGGGGAASSCGSARRGRAEATSTGVASGGVAKKKVFTCSVPKCGKTFGKKNHVARHVQAVHLNVRPFVCRLCSFPFQEKRGLARHLKVHEKQRDIGLASPASPTGRPAAAGSSFPQRPLTVYRQ